MKPDIFPGCGPTPIAFVHMRCYLMLNSSECGRFVLTRKALSKSTYLFASEPCLPEWVKGGQMETRVAIIGIIVENPDSVAQINDILHEVRDYVVGRMGIPYKERNISIISVVVDAPENLISSVSGKLGMLDGVSAKITYSRLAKND